MKRILFSLVLALTLTEGGSAKQADSLQIAITAVGTNTVYSLNDRVCSRPGIEKLLDRFAAISKTYVVVIQCEAKAPVELLLGFIDMCKRKGFQTVRVFVMRADGQTTEVTVGATTNLPPFESMLQENGMSY